MNKKSAKRKRKNLITKLAMTSALTLGVGAAATMTGQIEVRADSILRLDMTNQKEVDEFAEKLKSAVRKENGTDTWNRLSLILNGYKHIKEKIEKDLAEAEQTKNMYGKQLGLTEQAYQSEKAKKEKLEAELKENQQKIQELNAQVDGTAKEKQDLQEQLNKEKEAKTALQEQLETSKQRIQELEAELNKLAAEKAALQEKLAMQEQAHAEEKAKLQNQIDELMAQIEKLKHCQDTPKPEQPKPEQPKPEQPKPEQPKPEQPKPEQPKPEQPKPEQPKPEQPKPEQPKPEQPKPEQPKPMTKPGAKKSEQSLPSTGDIRNPFFTPAAIAIMIAAGTIAIPKRKKED